MTDVIDTQGAGTQGTGNEQKPYYADWGLSQENIGWLQSTGYSDPTALIEGFKSTKKFVGTDKNTLIRIPKPAEDGTVDYSEVYKQLGRPDDAKGYELGDTDFAKAASEKLFELGLSKKQATELAAFIAAQDEVNKKAEEETWNTNVEKGIKELQKEWGADYDANKAVAQQAVRDIAAKTGFTEEELNKIESTLGTDKATKLFYAIGAAQGGVKNLQNYNAGQETPEIAAFKLKELKQDKEFVARLAKNEHKAVQEMNRLTALAMGGNK